MILQSRFIIVNINGRNPNVFYELGIAQSIGKPTLILSKTINDIPFDISSQNMIIYNSSEELESHLHKTLRNVLIND